MPARSKPLDPAEGPLARFALELRELRDTAPPHKPDKDSAPKVISVAKAADQEGAGTNQDAIHAALAGRRLPSRETLMAMVRAWAPRGIDDLPRWMERRRSCEDELAGAAATRTSGLPSIIATSAVNEDIEEWVDALARRLGRERTEKGNPSLRALARNIDNSVSTATLSDALSGRRLPSLKTLNALLDAMESSSETRDEIRALRQEARDQLGGNTDSQTYHQEFDLAMMDPALTARHFSEMIETDRWLGVIRRLAGIPPGRATTILEEMNPQVVTRLLIEMDPGQAAPLLIADPGYGAARLTEMETRQAAARLLAIQHHEEAAAVLTCMKLNQAAEVLVEIRSPIAAASMLKSSYDQEWINEVLGTMDSEYAVMVREEIEWDDRTLTPKLP